MQGENLLNEDDIIKMMEEEGDQIAVALLPAIQYYTGQLLDVAKLTKVAQEKGITVGVDLAHAIGNVPIHLDDWNVDFAAWCTYKVRSSPSGRQSGRLFHHPHHHWMTYHLFCFAVPPSPHPP